MKKLLLILAMAPAIVMAKVPDSGFYTDLGLGVSQINYYNSSGSSGTLRIDEGYNLNKIVGFQLGANSFFGTTISNNQLGTYNVNGYGFDLSVLPNLPLGDNNQVNLFLRAGVGYDVMNAPIGNVSSMVDVIGAGVRYDITAHLGITAQYIGRGVFLSPAPSNYSQNDFLLNLGLFY